MARNLASEKVSLVSHWYRAKSAVGAIAVNTPGLGEMRWPIPEPGWCQEGSGHANPETAGDKYNHLRPEYLKDFVAGIEAFWTEVDAFTDVHRRLATAR